MFETHMVVTFLASFLVWFMVLGVFLLWYLLPTMTTKRVVAIALAVLVSGVAAYALKNVIPTSRPFHENGRDPLTITIPQDGAFPSIHTTVALAITLPLWRVSRRMGAIYTVMAILVAVGRVLANVHFIQDIIGGAILGGVIGWSTRVLDS